MKTKLLSKIICNVLAVLVGLLTVGGAIANANASAINSFLGASTQKTIKVGDSTPVNYYDTAYDSIDELRAASEAINEEVVGEGMVLLKNENNALPLSTGVSVTLYSANSVTFVHAGNGSSSNLTVNVAKNAVSLKDGLEQCGLKVNEGLWNWYKAHPEYWQGKTATDSDGNKYSYLMGSRDQSATFTLKDASWNQLPEDAKNNADAAIMVLSRNGGENADFVHTSSIDYLALSDNEKDILVNLKRLKDNGTIGKIIVLLNSANPLSLDFVDNADYGVDALLWVGMVGSTGTRAIGRVLTGEISPSGKLSDTYWKDNNLNPVMANFGHYEYDNSEILAGLRDDCNRTYVVYQEGIYNGYRYTETRYEDYVNNADNVGNFVYADNVAYPFGYGLSYTQFQTTLDEVSPYVNKDNSVSYNVTVTVKNIGSVDAKQVVQVYLQKPYTDYDKQYGIEKASVELVGYAKTKLLTAGESQTLTLNIAERLFASYDSVMAKTYVVGSTNPSDKYYLTVADGAHRAINNILAAKGITKDNNERVDGQGNAEAVWSTNIDFSDTKYALNENIKQANSFFKARYEGEVANYGVDKITNRFDDVDFSLYQGFSQTERSQKYTTRLDWVGTTAKTIGLTATEQLREDHKTPVPQTDNVEYPAMGEDNGQKLILLRADEQGNLLDYDNPLWETLMNRVTWDELCTFLSNGLRLTDAIASISAPRTVQFNGAVGPVPGDDLSNSNYGFNNSGAEFQGFAKQKGGSEEYPNFFCCNGLVASTFNTELAERLGAQIGEECLWVGMSGIYGYGVNLHRGAYCGRNFEYYSEDSYLSGMACAAEVKGTQSKGVFVILKHALLNEQETNRHAGNTWANEQTIRELYAMPIELCINYGDEMKMMGVMTSLTRMGAKWSSVQGFCNTVLRGEMGLNGFVISDFYSKIEKNAYMNPVAGVMYGNDLPDGTVVSTNKTYDGVTNDFNAYGQGYGKLAWQMRDAAHRILYVVARSSAMNLMTSDMIVVKITPTWQTLLKVVTIVSYVLLAASIAFVAVCRVPRKRKTEPEQCDR